MILLIAKRFNVKQKHKFPKGGQKRMFLRPSVTERSTGSTECRIGSSVVSLFLELFLVSTFEKKILNFLQIQNLDFFNGLPPYHF